MTFFFAAGFLAAFFFAAGFFFAVAIVLLLSIVGPKCLSRVGRRFRRGPRHYQALGFLDRTVKPGGSFPVPRGRLRGFDCTSLVERMICEKIRGTAVSGRVKRDYLIELARRMVSIRYHRGVEFRRFPPSRSVERRFAREERGDRLSRAHLDGARAVHHHLRRGAGASCSWSSSPCRRRPPRGWRCRRRARWRGCGRCRARRRTRTPGRPRRRARSGRSSAASGTISCHAS